MNDPVQAEQAILGALLRDGERVSEALDLVRDGDFRSRETLAVWRVMADLERRSAGVDAVSVRAALEANPGTAQMGEWPERLAGYMESVTSSAYLRHHCRILSDAALARGLAEACGEGARDACEARPGTGEVQEILQAVEGRIFSLGDRETGELALVSYAEAIPRAVERMTSPCAPEGAMTGLLDLDKILLGLRAGELVVLAGRPGMGKTALALQVCRSVAARDVRTLVVSLEMTAEQLAERAVGAEAKINSAAIRGRSLQESERGFAALAGDYLADLPITICDARDMTPSRLRGLCRRFARSGGLGLVVVDYLQLMRVPGMRERHQEVGEISRASKTLAKELAVPVLMLAQLNRLADGERPRLAHLRESGQIEQDADAVLLLMAEQYDKDREDAEVRLVVDVAKNRHGRTGEVHLHWNKATGHIGNAALRGQVEAETVYA